MAVQVICAHDGDVRICASVRNVLGMEVKKLMATICRLIGGAGTGKTTELLRIMGEITKTGIDATEIGFVSFTRAARAEAAGRAAEAFGVELKALERDGWFKTLHSVCYRCLGVSGGLITCNKESREWMRETLQEEVEATSDDSDLSEIAFAGQSRAAKVLNLWSASRNRLVPFHDVWLAASRVDDDLPDLEYCTTLIGRYESMKIVDHRHDFTDLLLRFAGKRCTVEGIYDREPEGWVPSIPVWFFDEQQDTSRLLDLVCHRLIATPDCKWVYVVGDPFQAIYSWAGADAKWFMAWPAAKERIMPKSYRCPPAIIEAGERALRRCTNYFDRGIAAADHEGEIDTQWGLSLDEINPAEDWLILARTNFQANRLAQRLDVLNKPWQPTRGNGGWKAPSRSAAITALWTIANDGPIDGYQWQHVIKALPSKLDDGRELFVRGTKARFSEFSEADKYPFVLPHELEQLGATPVFSELCRKALTVTRGQKSDFLAAYVDKGVKTWDAIEAHGPEVACDPKIKVGTIHSVKGQEADNVLLLTTTSATVGRSLESDEGRDEEQRCIYVGITRARKRLVVARERGVANSMEIDL